MNPQPLILASSSAYRSELLKRLGVPFQVAVPDIDETPLHGEGAQQIAWRLSREKARAVAPRHPDALIIASDQVAILDERLLGKPLTHDAATQQLKAIRGKSVVFYTALTVLNARSDEMETGVVQNCVGFREFDDAEIESYLRKEKPYDCVGGIKSEGLGIALISKIEGDDPNALIGLPLILLVGMLKRHGAPIP
ncbi:MAG: septum formation protein Maf [Candidatus Nitrotoga sp.]|nr:septum formation protein Maf [Candidatus Nitrotoga sp.]MBP0118012.1 septum formation protein Maf [Candidatus Nitrotoga sp.]